MEKIEFEPSANIVTWTQVPALSDLTSASISS